jgi:phage terminase large subunit-like protein
VLNALRDKGLEDKTPSLRWLEWSAHPSLKITDPKAWAQANPALGHTITAEILEHRILTGEPNQVRTEMLTQWVQNLASPWPINAWMDNKVEDMVFEPGASTFFAMDISPSRRHAALVAGQLNGDKVKLKCLQTWNAQSSIDDLRMASEINEHIKRFKPKMLLFDRYTSAGVAARLAHTGVLVTEISGQLFASACDEMLAAMSHNRIEHSDQYELSESVNSCAMRTTDSGWRIVRRKSAGGEVAAAIASAMVIWYANKPQAVAAIYVN